MTITAYAIALRFIGLKELAGNLKNHPLIMAMLQLDTSWPPNDETPWCSAFANSVCWLLNLPRSKSLAARSWLEVGRPVDPDDARVGFDIVVLSREGGGHVGFFAGFVKDGVSVLGGNQGNAVSIATFPLARILSIRRLHE